MSDIEKRKELSGEENFEDNTFNEEKKDEKNQKSAEKEGSQSADQGSVTHEKNEPADKTADIPADDPREKPQPGSEEVPASEPPERPATEKPSAAHPVNDPENQPDQPAENHKDTDQPDKEHTKPEEQVSAIPEGDLKTDIADIQAAENTSEPATDPGTESGRAEESHAPADGERENEKKVGLPQEINEEEQVTGPDAEEKELTEKDTAEEKEQPASEEAQHEGDGGEDDEEDEEKDYSTFGKEEIIHELEELLKVEDIKKIEKPVRELKSFYDDIFEHERKESLQKFLDGGGAEVDFEYAGDALDNRFATVYEKYKTRKNNYYANLDKERDVNLQKKHAVLEKLRNLVDGEETTTSIGALKEIQKEWKDIGPVPGQYAKSLWATYNILIDRFYDNRSIYFELKELDRKKNLEGKLELCERAEELAASGNIKEAVKELNELHEEFKHIGPVPKEVQEEVWQRFKAASDAIYAKRKEFVGRLKKDLNENLKHKMDLVEEAGKFSDFDSDKISDWNEKTKQILDLQKKWENVGGLPREHARDVNKSFWSNFKSFFNNKNRFFKKLEGQRDENLVKKEELVRRAEALKESDDWEGTAEKLKELQKEWKNIGPVPEKFRNEIYKQFKSACDTFFDRRRTHSRDVEGDYRENLKNKEKICEEIEGMLDKGNLDPDRFRELHLEYHRIGYVPRNAIRKIQKKYDTAVSRFLEAIDLPGAEKSELKFAAEVNRLKSGPNAGQKIQRKESELRRMIGKLENDISLWKNNLEFFAESKTADKLRDEFNKKIQEASEQLDELKEELKVLNKID